MPWQTNPTFVDDAVLSASQLNMLSDNILFLQGVATATNVPLAMAFSAPSAEWYYYIKRRHPFLWFSYNIDVDDAGSVRLYVDAEMLYEETNPTEGDHLLVFDLEVDLVTTPPLGSAYTIRIEYNNNINSEFTLLKLWESEASV